MFAQSQIHAQNYMSLSLYDFALRGQDLVSIVHIREGRYYRGEQ